MTVERLRQKSSLSSSTLRRLVSVEAPLDDQEPFDSVFDSVSSPKFGNFVQTSLKDSQTYHWAIVSFIRNNLARRYRRSVLGFFWGLIGPLMTMSIMTVAFALLFHVNAHKAVSYIFSGLVAWTFINDSAMQGSQTFISAETYLKKLAVPKIFFPLVTIGTEAINFLFSLTGLLLLTCVVGVQLHWTLFALPAAIAILAIYNLGIALIYGIGTVYFRDLPHILGVVYPAFFYAIPVFYPIEAIPANYHYLFYINPFFWFINLFRHLMYDGHMPTAAEWFIPLAISLCTLLTGMFILRLKHRTLIYRL